MKQGTGFKKLEIFIMLAAAVYMAVTDTAARTYWPFMLSAYVLAAMFYFWERRQALPHTKGGLGGYLFPKNVWLHDSAVQDYLLFIVNSYIVYALTAWVLAAHVSLFFQPDYIEAAIGRLDSAPRTGGGQAGPAALALYTAAVVVVGELFYYFAHRLSHEIPALWAFHKVHHSAKVLTPITVFRMHLFNSWWDAGLSAVGTGLVAAVFLHFYPGTKSVVQIMGINAVLLVFYFIGSNLRHSHIWISFPPSVAHVFLSPAQHQIHHSENLAHFNKNYGSHIAIWDWLFGSLYVPKGREKLTFGLGSASAEAPYKSVWGMFVYPFQEAFKRKRRKAR